MSKDAPHGASLTWQRLCCLANIEAPTLVDTTHGQFLGKRDRLGLSALLQVWLSYHGNVALWYYCDYAHCAGGQPHVLRGFHLELYAEYFIGSILTCIIILF